ncbi:CoA transferase [Comamonas sp. NLF-1-9]|uniref:CoA transferase n=1 Tax=Comamonas sp. NLF-1-9 TaxID=2853163 RepID=UPI001C445EAA|nr:CoA transferase [Comamonas sp. NLF-1-9]QXL84769.1 CoA transferase [Comamonas sp. NLF-1-9]
MQPFAVQALQGTRILSLALNLPGPAALMRCQSMGATCTKVEPLPAPTQTSGDPMGVYCPPAYREMHADIRVLQLDLKSAPGRTQLAGELAQSDVLLTSFRPSALAKLGLSWQALQASHPRLSLVRIVGSPGEAAEEPGHDLTYLAQAGLIAGTDLPPTLFADMGGALMASEAVLQAQLARAQTQHGVCIEVALSDAADWLALPRQWQLTGPHGAVGGAHAFYRIYPCADGRVALAALEPHFAARMLAQLGLAPGTDPSSPQLHEATAQWLSVRSRAELDALARAHDIPLHTLA